MKTDNHFSQQKGLTKLGVIGFIVWSTIMLVVGHFLSGQIRGNADVSTSSDVIASVKTATSEPQNKNIIRLDRERLSGNKLGEFAPYEPENGNLIARGYDYFYSLDGNFGIGVWESKPGEMTYVDLEYDELMVVLDGSLVMTNQQGKVETFAQGEGLVLPKGWSGTLAVPEGGVRKIWVSYMGGVKGE